jgi:hypothetical protein
LGSLAVCLVLVEVQSGPPVALVRNVTDTYFGQQVVDP